MCLSVCLSVCLIRPVVSDSSNVAAESSRGG